MWMLPSSSLTGWSGLGIVPLNNLSRAIPALESHTWPSWLHLVPGKGGSAPAASIPSVWPQEALEVEHKRNSPNPGNLLCSRWACGRPAFCGLHGAFASVSRCLCFDDSIPKMCLWHFSVSTNNMWKIPHRGPKSYGVACDPRALCLDTSTQALQVIWLPRAVRRLAGSMSACLCACCSPPCQTWIGIQLLCRKCQLFHVPTRIRKLF